MLFLNISLSVTLLYKEVNTAFLAFNSFAFGASGQVSPPIASEISAVGHDLRKAVLYLGSRDDFIVFLLTLQRWRSSFR
jgi:hypothetical protein